MHSFPFLLRVRRLVQAAWQRPGLLLSMLGGSLLLGLGLGLLLLHRPEVLADRYFQPYPDSLTYGEAHVSEADSLLFMGMAHYNSQQYAEAIPLFQQLCHVTPMRKEACFYGGVAQLAAGRAGEALRWFQEIPPEDSFGLLAQWYRSLAYLKLGEAQKSLACLQGLAEHPQAPFPQEVMTLRRQLRSPWCAPFLRP